MSEKSLDVLSVYVYCDTVYQPMKSAYKDFLSLVLPILMEQPEEITEKLLLSCEYKNIEKVTLALQNPETVTDYVLVFGAVLAERLELSLEFGVASFCAFKSLTKMYSLGKKLPNFETFIQRWYLQFMGLHNRDLSFMDEMSTLRNKMNEQFGSEPESLQNVS